MLIKGIKHNKGSFIDRKTGNNVDYENFQLFGLDDKGEWCMEKVPARVMSEAGVYNAEVLIENEIEIFFNRYGSVVSVRIK